MFQNSDFLRFWKGNNTALHNTPLGNGKAHYNQTRYYFCKETYENSQQVGQRHIRSSQVLPPNELWKRFQNFYFETISTGFWACSGRLPSWKMFFSSKECFLVQQNHAKPPDQVLVWRDGCVKYNLTRVISGYPLCHVTDRLLSSAVCK